VKLPFGGNFLEKGGGRPGPLSACKESWGGAGKRRRNGNHLEERPEEKNEESIEEGAGESAKAARAATGKRN